MTGAIRSSSTATARWTSAIWGGGGGASGTGQQSSGDGVGRRFGTARASRVAGVLRPVSLLPALVVVATLLGFGTGTAEASAPRQARQEAVRTPLAVSIDSLAPSVIPKRGPVTVTGTVTNRDDETRTDISVYASASATPMTTASELADAAAIGPSQPVGDRILDTGSYDDTIGELAPGESRQYSLEVSHAVLASHISGGPGVYWFGAHALGFNAEGGDSNADGRART